MYISEIRLKNIRCFEDLRIDLEAGGKPVLWTMVTGDNAVGKTTLLQSIGLGLCDEASAAALLKEMPGQFLRSQGQSATDEVTGSIEVTLKGKQGTFTVTTEISEKPRGSPERVDQQIHPKALFSWRYVFVCGYGPHRATAAVASHEKYKQLEAVYTLFNYESSLQNPELIYRRQPESYRQQIEKKLMDVLMLDDSHGSVQLTDRGMEIRGPWGTLPVEVLSDGYKSTTQWLLDFYGWQLYAGKIGNDEEISGILLIDELEQHIHPKWQREIISRLRRIFPGVQFIATTHSPILASSIGRLEPSAASEKLVHLELRKGNKSRAHELESLKGLNVDQILASRVFDYLIAADPDIENVLREASELAGKGRERTSKENKRYQAIKKALKRLMQPEGRTLIERVAEEELYRGMKRRIAELQRKLGVESYDKNTES